MSGSILNKQGFGIPTITIDGEDYLSLTFMCKDVDYKPKDKIRNYLSDPAKLRYVFALERAMNPGFKYAITKDGYIVNTTDPVVEIGGGGANGPLSLINGQNKVRVESLITTYGLHSLYLKKGGRNSGQGIYAHHLERSVCAIIAEYPLDQKKWVSAIEREASEHMTRLDKLNRYSDGKAFDESLSIGSIPNGYDSRTISARESASAKFKEELLTGKIHYDKNDDVFRDTDGFIRLGWKI